MKNFISMVHLYVQHNLILNKLLRIIIYLKMDLKKQEIGSHKLEIINSKNNDLFFHCISNFNINIFFFNNFTNY